MLKNTLFAGFLLPSAFVDPDVDKHCGKTPSATPGSAGVLKISPNVPWYARKSGCNASNGALTWA